MATSDETLQPQVLRSVAWLSRATVALLLLLALEAAPARSAEALFAEAPALQLLDESGERLPPLRQASELSLRINGLVAVAVLRQRFENGAEAWAQGVYSFPLPEQAAVRRLDFVLGDRVVRGRVREREEAKREFDAARARGDQAALVSQERPNLFTSHLANIPPGEAIELRLELVLPVAYRDGEFSLRFPSTITARYIPGEPTGARTPAGWSPPTERVPDAARITPFQHPRPGSDAEPLNPLSLALELDAGVPLAELSARYHELAIERDGGRYRARLRDGVAEMDRDLVLSWRPVRGAAPQAALYGETRDGAHYAYLMLVPPRGGPVAPPPRELVLVVDRSGSMGGAPMRQAKASARAALARLQPEDRFNVIAFDDRVEALFVDAQPVTPQALARARRFVDGLDARGGTELRSALERALPAGETVAGGILRQVVFITDGAVGNERELFGVIRERLGRSRLFTVGIGAAPNGWFMRRAAEAGRGTFTHVGRREEAGASMDALLARLGQPVLTDIEVDWPAGAEVVPAVIPDLYRGEPVQQAVRLDGPLRVPVTVRGSFEGAPLEIALAPGRLAGDAEGVATLWARGRVQRLLDELDVGAERAQVRDAVLPLALAHELLTPFTSFVAVEAWRPRPGDAPAREHAVPNTRPAGQAPQHFAFPQTATTARARFYLGLLALFIALFAVALREDPEAP